MLFNWMDTFLRFNGPRLFFRAFELTLAKTFKAVMGDIAATRHPAKGRVYGGHHPA